MDFKFQTLIQVFFRALISFPLTIVPPSTLLESIKVLTSDEDPDKAFICSDIQSFVYFLNLMIDRILHQGSPFDSFRRSLNRHVAGIREDGYPELADSIEAYLAQLKQQFEHLRDLKTSGVSSYVSTQIDLKLQEWHASQKSAELELQKLRDRVTQMRLGIAKKVQAKVGLL